MTSDPAGRRRDCVGPGRSPAKRRCERLPEQPVRRFLKISKHRLVDSDVTAISSITYACKCEPQAVINAARCHNIPIRAAYLGIWINRIPTHFLRECLLEQRMIEARRRDAIAAEKRLAEPDQAIAKADQAHTTEQARLQSMVTPRTALDAATFNRCQPGPALACAAQARCWRVGQQARRWLA